MEEVASFFSRTQARLALEEMARQGGLQVIGKAQHSAIYIRRNEGGEERLYVDTKGKRLWVIFKVKGKEVHLGDM